MLKHGFCAEIIIGKEHLRLFSEDGSLGVQASVYKPSLVWKQARSV